MPRSTIQKQAEQIRTHRVEWLTGLFSTLIVLAISGWMAVEAATTADRPPELSAHVLAIDPLPSGWRVTIQIRNEGDQAAAAVVVKAKLLDGETSIEDAETTFDYVAAGSTSRGGMIFESDPARHRLHIMPSGYTEP